MLKGASSSAVTTATMPSATNASYATWAERSCHSLLMRIQSGTAMSAGQIPFRIWSLNATESWKNRNLSNSSNEKQKKLRNARARVTETKQSKSTKQLSMARNILMAQGP